HSGTSAGIWAGNYQIVNHEQNVTLAPHYVFLRAWNMVDPAPLPPFLGVPVSSGLTMGSYLRAPFAGAPTFLEHASTLWNPADPIASKRYITFDSDRWGYIGGNLWTRWKQSTPAVRYNQIQAPLP
ncbi:MAG TPA: hypothetical protein VF624_09685, partial [Tepidisphaeraceae bacterium]